MNESLIEVKPIKRHNALKPVSREHHHALLLVWKIRKGLRAGIDNARIKRYADWFFSHYIASHIATEENVIYPILANDKELLQRVLAEHKQLISLFTSDCSDAPTLASIADLLESHIRFEERTLFNIIQEKATLEQLVSIEASSLSTPFVENEADIFW